MRTKGLRIFQRAIAEVSFFLLPFFVQAQVFNPSTWNQFVNGNGNPLVSDTFRLQSFRKQAVDNWNYVARGGAAVPSGKRTMLLYAGSSLVFDPFSVTGYQEVTMGLRYAWAELVKEEKLQASCTIDGQLCEIDMVSPPSANKSKLEHQAIASGASSLELRVLKSSQTKNGYYCTDSVYVFGSIPRYSLFSGRGDWNDTVCWSHLPPLRHRNALIGGEVAISTPVRCNSMSIAEGELTIKKEGSLAVDSVITVYRTFAEKGKWYFISFPYDVWPDGLDDRFSQKDGQPNIGGNYLYIQEYDGNNRALTNQANGNWKVLPVRTSASGQPLFQKNKGYLVALDGQATDYTVAFSSKKGMIPSGFGKIEETSVVIVTNGLGEKSHAGWYLCGNPFLSSISLSHIQLDPVLDGNIYLYDGRGYQGYPIGSNYRIPPLAAFFVKASAAITLRFTEEEMQEKGILLRADFPLSVFSTEPVSANEATSISLLDNQVAISISGNKLHIANLPSRGQIQIVDMAGRICYRKEVVEGVSLGSLPLPPGVYLLQIEADCYRDQYKFSIAH